MVLINSANVWGPGSTIGSDDEIVALAEPGRFFGDVLDTSSAEGVVVVCDAGGTPALIALDISPAAIELAGAHARREGLLSATFAVTEISPLLAEGGTWAATMGRIMPSPGSGLCRFLLVVDVATIRANAADYADAVAQCEPMLGGSWAVDYLCRSRLYSLDLGSILGYTDHDSAADPADVSGIRTHLSAWLLALRRIEPSEIPR